MKTLDEVIEAERHCVSGGCIGCPYENDEDGCNCDEDALHYLKELQELKNTNVYIPDGYIQAKLGDKNENAG